MRHTALINKQLLTVFITTTAVVAIANNLEFSAFVNEGKYILGVGQQGADEVLGYIEIPLDIEQSNGINRSEVHVSGKPEFLALADEIIAKSKSLCQSAVFVRSEIYQQDSRVQ